MVNLYKILYREQGWAGVPAITSLQAGAGGSVQVDCKKINYYRCNITLCCAIVNTFSVLFGALAQRENYTCIKLVVKSGLEQIFLYTLVVQTVFETEVAHRLSVKFEFPQNKLSRSEISLANFIPPANGVSQGTYFLPKSHKLVVFEEMNASFCGFLRT